MSIDTKVNIAKLIFVAFIVIIFTSFVTPVKRNSFDFENANMMIDCLDSQLFVAMQENEDIEFANLNNRIELLRTDITNGNINYKDFLNTVNSIENEIN